MYVGICLYRHKCECDMYVGICLCTHKHECVHACEYLSVLRHIYLVFLVCACDFPISAWGEYFERCAGMSDSLCRCMHFWEL